MLAMKCVAARFDTYDADDVRFLLEHLGIETAEQACRIIKKYYPHEAVPPKTQFLLEELLRRTLDV
jgi:hypothetical protein